MKYALKLIFLKCIFELMINTAQPASKSVYAEKNGFDITNLIFQNMYVWQCGAAVKELLAAADELGSTPGNTAFSVCLYRCFPFFSV